jgi:hypothetical protein
MLVLCGHTLSTAFQLNLQNDCKLLLSWRQLLASATRELHRQYRPAIHGIAALFPDAALAAD